MLISISDDLWVVDGECVKFWGFVYPTRSVVVRLNNGGIWVWSPIQCSEELAREVANLGPVTHLVSPCPIHHLFIGDWKERFPEAKIWGPLSTQKKRADLTFEPALTDDAPDDWCEEIEQFHVDESQANDEVLFLHHKSNTLIMADFSENFTDEFLKTHWRPWQRWIARHWGVVKGKGYAPLDWRVTFRKRTKLKELKATLLSRPVENVIMAHGTMQISNGQAYLNQCLAWI
ncbi:hypothetical protein ROA7450_01733 [Roseovarius albus]|uniref:DUF4336 domain-containing protein n=1 Tax=Roseovarius albus TaxID=1247867 RepID=A0A1X6YZS0_9RHOB|nr:DUF4336 domain-containing protein [Roseovarius albus]SLN36559.1 hypothetical protein ROA7450_01733 [Roseovarius albus]